jgi:hypothetical protein
MNFETANFETLNFETLAIHAGQEPDPVTGAVVPPIYQTSTYKQDGIGGTRGGYEYSRTANPTRTALETCLAALENGARAFAFASGMAAEDCLVRTLCRPGDRVLIPGDAYGGTYRLFDKVFKSWGIEYEPVLQTDLGAVARAAAAQRPRLIWAETPTNPLLSVVDIRALAEIARQHGALLVVDNTFASPYLQRPDVDHGEQRIRGRLGPDNAGRVSGRRPGHGAEVGLQDGLVFHPPVLEDLVEQAVGAAVGVAGDQHPVARPAQRADQAVLGGHAGGEGERPRAVLQRGQAGLQRGPGGVRGTRVLVAAPGPADAVLLVGRGLVDRRHHRAGDRVGFLARVDGQGLEVQPVEVHCAPVA